MLTAECPRPKILVADDDPQNLQLLADLLTAQGFDVITASDGNSALEAVQRRDVSLALLDVLMPGHTGFAVCRMIKSVPETRFIPVVLVTGLTNKEDRIQGIECGGDDFLNKPFHKEELLARVRSLLRLKHFTDELENAETVLFSLALGIESKDPYTGGHCERLSRYSVALGKQLGLPEEHLVALRRAGIVHDIGKLAVPEYILLKPGPLTPGERKVMEQHPAAGERICAPLRSFRHVLPIIRHHHERMDGSGYPDGLRGDMIPLTARVLQTVDVYDALATDRPYRRALSRPEALRVMRQEVRRGWWDGSIVDCFEALLSAPRGILRPENLL